MREKISNKAVPFQGIKIQFNLISDLLYINKVNFLIAILCCNLIDFQFRLDPYQ